MADEQEPVLGDRRRAAGALEPPAQITGYGEPEGEWCNLLSEHGHYSFHFGENWSFHIHVPAKQTPFRQRTAFTPENTQPDPGKYYVCFMTSEGDTMKGPLPFFFGSWFEEERGRTPINWGINPLMATQFPAMLEYFYETATPNDYFFVGCSGAGYCYPDHMPNLEQFAGHTARACTLAGTPCIDMWGARRSRVISTYAGITGSLGITINASPARVSFLEDGTPVACHELAYWQSSVAGTDGWSRVFRDDEKRADAIKQLVTKIENIAQRHYPPFVILVYADLHNWEHHCKMHAEVAQALDPARFKPARLDEAMSAMRAWARDKVLIGADSINQRLSWVVLQDTPTTVPLLLANNGAEATDAKVQVKGDGWTCATTVTLAANESKRLSDLRLTVPDTDAQTAVLHVASRGKVEELPVDLAVIPGAQSGPHVALEGAWGAVGLRHHDGSVLDEPAALFGKAWQSPDPGEKPGHVVFGPYAEMPPGRYLVAFRMRLAGRATDAGARVASLDVFAGGYDGIAKTLASRDLTADDFAEGWDWFLLEGDWPGDPSLMETRVWWDGTVRLAIDRIAALRMA